MQNKLQRAIKTQHEKYKASNAFDKIRQIVMGKFAEIQYCTIPHIADIRYCKNARPARALKIRRDTVLYNTVYQCNKVMEEVDNTSSTFISVFFTDIQEWALYIYLL